MPVVAKAGSAVTSTVELATSVAPAGSVNSPVRISGPFVSSAMAMFALTSAAARRTLLIVCRWKSCEPCEKFMRATAMPAPMSSFKPCTVCVLGPIVQMMLFMRITCETSAS